MKKSPRIQENGRFSAKRKTEAVLRLLRGEDLELLSREYKITAAIPGEGLSISGIVPSDFFTLRRASFPLPLA